jgi:hypothetical protein
MSTFRNRILGVATLTAAFVGVSYGQISTCTTAAQSNPTLRAEGQTELLAQMVVSCTNSGAATSGTVYITTSLPITSKSFTGATGPTSEATLIMNPTAPTSATPTAAITGGTPFTGVVSGSQVSFNVPGTGIPAGAFTFVIANIRVNASAGNTPQVTESGVLSTALGTTSTNTTIPGATTGGPGYILKSLGAPTLVALGTTNYTVCVGNPVPTTGTITPSFTVNINELVGGAFQTAAGEAGQYVSGTNTGSATADIITLTLANVPASATIYVPSSVGTGTVLTTTGTPLSTGPLTGYVAFTPTSGTVTIPYTVATATATGAQTFPVPVFMSFAANSAAAQTGVTANYTYSPNAAALTGPASAVPTFLASSFTAVTGSAINLCNTTLLFPFITNQLGFDTGIVLSNTSTDNIATGGKSAATPQSGTCTLSFYGSGAPSPATGVADPLGVASATNPVHAFTASAVAPGFQGYVIASCPFQYAHGYAFITYNLTQNNGVAEGYVALTLQNNRPATSTTNTSTEPVSF